MMAAEEWERYSWTENKVTVKSALTGMHRLTPEHWMMDAKANHDC